VANNSYRVLSLDVSSTSTGWSFITERKNSLKFGTIRPDRKLSVVAKLNFFRVELIKVLKKYKPTYIVLEDTFMGANPKVTKLLAKFGGVAEQTVYEYSKKEPYVMSNTTPKSFFKAKKKEKLFVLIIDLLDFTEKMITFKEWNDIADSIAQLWCYCDEVLEIKKIREEKEYGYRFRPGSCNPRSH